MPISDEMKPRKKNSDSSRLEDEIKDVFGKCLAKFVVETASLLQRRGYLPNPDERVELQDQGVDWEREFESSPAWVKREYEKAKASKGTGLTDAAARAFVARNRLLSAMKQRGWSQAELARRLKKSPTVISRIFKSPERSRVATLWDIADALDVDLSDVLRPEGR